MTLTIHTEEDEQRQLKMTVEVAEDRVQRAMRLTARKLAREFNIPGFRKGKAPYQVVLRRFGEDALRADVVEDMLQDILEEAIEQAEADIYAPPSLDDMQLEPLVFTFTVPLSPKVELGDYRQLRKEVEPVQISDDAIDEALEQVRIRHQVLEEVDRPAALGDVVTVSGRGELLPEDGDENEDAETEETISAADEDEAAANTENEIIFDEESIDLLLDEEKLFSGTPFVDNIVGLTTGERKSFGFRFPEDYEEDELAGKEVSFKITVLNVQDRELPELNDELAKADGDYQSLDELRESLAENLEQQAISEAKNELIENMVDDLLVDAQMVYPPAAVEQEIDSMMETFKARITRSGWEWDDYMQLRGDNEASVREEFREQAVENLKRRLALRQFILEEQLTVEEEDVELAVAERVERFSDNEELRASMDNYFRSGYGFDMISSEILMDKAHQRIEAVLTGNAPDLEATVDDGTDDGEEEEE